jgi:hypothetical protein
MKKSCSAVLDTYILFSRTFEVHLDPRLDGTLEHAMTERAATPLVSACNRIPPSGLTPYFSAVKIFAENSFCRAAVVRDRWSRQC